MKQNIFCSVVIVAGGNGKRMGADISKQYLNLNGKPVLAWTIEVFNNSKRIDEIIVVVNNQDIGMVKKNIINTYGFNKVKMLVGSGPERQNSVYNGLKAVDGSCDIVLIHDGARPFVNEELIETTINAALETGAVCAAVPVKDTIKQADGFGFVEFTPDRSRLWSVQTPQVFNYELILEAHRRAEDESFLGTDDAMLAERYGTKVKLVMGSYFNIKLTTPEDMRYAEQIIRELN